MKLAARRLSGPQPSGRGVQRRRSHRPVNQSWAVICQCVALESNREVLAGTGAEREAWSAKAPGIYLPGGPLAFAPMGLGPRRGWASRRRVSIAPA